MSPAYTDHKPTMKEQRRHKRQVRKFYLAVLPAVIVAIVYLALGYL